MPTWDCEAGNEKGDSLRVRLKLVAMPIQKFPLLCFHHRIVKTEEEDREGKQQPVTLTRNNNSQSHKERAKIERVARSCIRSAHGQFPPFINVAGSPDPEQGARNGNDTP